MIDGTTMSGVDMSLETRGTTTGTISAQTTKSIARIAGAGIIGEIPALRVIEEEDVIATEMTREDMCNMRGVREIKMMKARPVLHIHLFSLCLTQVITRGKGELMIRI